MVCVCACVRACVCVCVSEKHIIFAYSFICQVYFCKSDTAVLNGADCRVYWIGYILCTNSKLTLRCLDLSDFTKLRLQIYIATALYSKQYNIA